jgi:hypothetical protein
VAPVFFFVRGGRLRQQLFDFLPQLPLLFLRPHVGLKVVGSPAGPV